MTEVTRFIEVDATRDYVIPAIQINLPVDKCYYKPVIHIGILGDEGNATCFCGQNHRTEFPWHSPNVSAEPNITCGGCLRTMRNIISDNPASPYKAVMAKLRQREYDAQFHVKKHGTSTSSGTYPPNTDELQRVVGNPVIDDTAALMDAICDMAPPEVVEVKQPIVEIPSALITRIEVRQYDHDLYSYGCKCNLCCFNGRRPCPKVPGKSFRNAGLMCETFGPNAFFTEVLIPYKGE